MPPRTHDQWICLAFRVRPEFLAHFVPAEQLAEIEAEVRRRLEDDEYMEDTARLTAALENLRCAREISNASSSPS